MTLEPPKKILLGEAIKMVMTGGWFIIVLATLGSMLDTSKSSFHGCECGLSFSTNEPNWKGIVTVILDHV